MAQMNDNDAALAKIEEDQVVLAWFDQIRNISFGRKIIAFFATEASRKYHRKTDGVEQKPDEEKEKNFQTKNRARVTKFIHYLAEFHPNGIDEDQFFQQYADGSKEELQRKYPQSQFHSEGSALDQEKRYLQFQFLYNNLLAHSWKVVRNMPEKIETRRVNNPLVVLIGVREYNTATRLDCVVNDCCNVVELFAGQYHYAVVHKTVDMDAIAKGGTFYVARKAKRANVEDALDFKHIEDFEHNVDPLRHKFKLAWTCTEMADFVEEVVQKLDNNSYPPCDSIILVVSGRGTYNERIVDSYGYGCKLTRLLKKFNECKCLENCNGPILTIFSGYHPWVKGTKEDDSHLQLNEDKTIAYKIPKNSRLITLYASAGYNYPLNSGGSGTYLWQGVLDAFRRNFDRDHDKKKHIYDMYKEIASIAKQSDDDVKDYIFFESNSGTTEFYFDPHDDLKDNQGNQANQQTQLDQATTGTDEVKED